MPCPTYYQQGLPVPSWCVVNPLLPMESRPLEEMQCMGINPDGTASTLELWKKYWRNQDNTHTSCTDVFYRLIYAGSSTDDRHTFSPDGFNRVKSDFDYMFSAYFNNLHPDDDRGGHKILVKGQAGYDEFQEILVDACSGSQHQLGGACQTAAYNMCTGCTTNQVTSATDLLRLCGCEVSSLVGYVGVPPECDPLCSQEDVSKKRDSEGKVQKCTATVCVINNVAISVFKSKVDKIQFTQVCPQCEGSNQCKCIVDASIPTIAETLGISDPNSFRQACGTNSVCMTIDPKTHKETVVPCNSVLQSIKPETYDSKVSNWVWVVATALLIIGLLVCISAVYEGKNIITTIPRMFHVYRRIPNGVTLTSRNFKR